MEPGLADNLMRLIAEGAGEEDEAADAELRAQAVSSYLALLEKPKLPDILLQVSVLDTIMSSSMQHQTLPCLNDTILCPILHKLGFLAKSALPWA